MLEIMELANFQPWWSELNNENFSKIYVDLSFWLKVVIFDWLFYFLGGLQEIEYYL